MGDENFITISLKCRLYLHVYAGLLCIRHLEHFAEFRHCKPSLHQFKLLASKINATLIVCVGGKGAFTYASKGGGKRGVAGGSRFVKDRNLLDRICRS